MLKSAEDGEDSPSLADNRCAHGISGNLALQSYLVLGQIAECLILVFNVAGLALVQFLEQQYFPSMSLPQDTVRFCPPAGLHPTLR